MLTLIVFGAFVSSFFGTRGLNQAVISARDLYSVDIAGSQMESDLEYETQESRRAFLDALAASDSSRRLHFMMEAGEASRRVDQTVHQLRTLEAAEVTPGLEDFERAWNRYDQTRAEVAALILVGNQATAGLVESARGQPGFASALTTLHTLKAALEIRARTDSIRANATLRRSIGGLAAFVASTFLILALLVKTNRSRRLALESLRATNGDLAAAKELERERASILEMVSTHAPLGRTLEKVVALAARSCAEAGATVWVGDANKQRLQVAANMPAEFSAALELHALPTAGPSPAGIEEFGQYSGKLASSFQYDASPPKELREASGARTGMLQMFAPAGVAVAWQPVLDEMGHLASVAIENSLLYERLAFQAQHDALTGLPNRLLFQDRVQQGIKSAIRHYKKAAVIWLDVDRYKQINDTLGHGIGDELLCEVARRLKGCLRQGDTVARVGGDEFTILAEDLTQLEDVEQVAAKILATFSAPFRIHPHEITIAGSLGVSIFPDHGEEPLTLLRNADIAMYSAKRAGGGSFRIFRSALSISLQRRVLLERELKTALERGELRVEYQPLLARNGHLDGIEALLRWNNPIAGQIAPVEFIPIAEETGLIKSIGEWVTRMACRDAARWLEQGYDVPRTAVNVSAVQLADGRFSALVEGALQEYGLPASRLELEITETALMNNLELVTAQIQSLRRLGVRFSIDDFGTGYSSLSQLQNLPVDCVKIDRSFIKDLEPGAEGCTTLVRGIIALAHGLGLDVVAEGVETAQQLKLLNALGCDITQGFFMHRPVPSEELEEMLRSTRPAAQ
ncbi:MAG: EAL domain-containing protein, partial [Bryobacterales bacterium]|nr:EAL domain-containing protein [Bryobacterales bacterium]